MEAQLGRDRLEEHALAHHADAVGDRTHDGEIVRPGRQRRREGLQRPCDADRRAAVDRVILAAGSKALAIERRSGATAGLGIALGGHVELVPNHACTCANLYAAYDVCEPAGWHRWRVEARGLEYGRSSSGSSLHAD